MNATRQRDPFNVRKMLFPYRMEDIFFAYDGDDELRLDSFGDCKEDLIQNATYVREYKGKWYESPIRDLDDDQYIAAIKAIHEFLEVAK